MHHTTIYLDHAAATPLDTEVFASMQPYLTDYFYNPSATYLAARSVAKDIESARQKVAHRLGSRPNEIVFTAGGTEANNLAISGILYSYPGANVVISNIEHESVLKPASQYEYRSVTVQPDGRIDLSVLRKSIDDNTVLVSIMYANNEIGTIQPLRRTAEILDEIKKDRQKRGIKQPLYFHTDACQAGLYLDLHVNSLGVDLMTLNGGKIYGPKQSGALFIKTGTRLKPINIGGGQERGMRSGTENVAGIMGFSTALDVAQARREEEAKRILVLRDGFILRLKQEFKEIIINGSLDYRLPNNIHATFPGQDNERVMMALDEAGIQCAVGSACSASSDEPSHVLAAIGLSDETAHSSLRFTLGRSNTANEIKHVIKVLAELIH